MEGAHRLAPVPPLHQSRPASWPAPEYAGWRLSLVLPAYNEAAGIRQAIAEADDALSRLATDPAHPGYLLDYEVLVVDDGSGDATGQMAAEESAARPRVRVLRHETNRGYGAALRTGFEAARFERVAFTDADCQFHLTDLARLLPLTEQAEVAAGYREARQDPWRRCFLSRGYNLLTRLLLGTRVRDCDCALKVYRREALAVLLPQTTGFFVNAEMLARARQQRFRVAEAGVRHRPRLRGVSKVSLAEVPRTLATLLPFWWSAVLFPGRPEGSGEAVAGPRRGPLPALLLLLALAGLLFLTRLRAPLLEPQEPRYAEIPRQMLAEGRLLVPVLHGQDYLDKPPLLYWLVMSSYRLFGVHDWAARLVPGLAGLLTVLLTYLWGRRAAGDRAALCGALVLCLSARFVYLERMLTMDSLLCLWVIAALAACHTALFSGTARCRWWLLGGTACGLGLLTKGPVTLALVGLPVLACWLLDRRCVRVRGRDGAIFLGAALCVAGPWYGAVMVQVPEFAGYFFWRHNLVRFVEPFDHAKPAWFHLPGLLLGMLPWTLLLPGLVRLLVRRSARSGARRPPALGFFLLASLWGLLFFSAAGCKRPVYILPVMPPLALALGCYLDVILPRGSLASDYRALWRWGSGLAFRGTLLVLALSGGAAALAGLQGLLKPASGLVLTGVAAAGLAILMLRRRRLSWAACAAITFTVLLAGVQQLHSAYNRQFAVRGRLRTDRALAGQAHVQVACYPQRWDSVSFYLPRADVRVYGPGQRSQLLRDLAARPRTLLLVKSGPELEGLVRDLPAMREFVPRGRPGVVTAGWVRPRRERAP